MKALGTDPHTVAVVIPVFQGERTLRGLVEEVLALTDSTHLTPVGRTFRVVELLLVHDCGPDQSDVVIRGLARSHDLVRPRWLSRDFGQHAATIAWLAS